jgi:hypothetical protein
MLISSINSSGLYTWSAAPLQGVQGLVPEGKPNDKTLRYSHDLFVQFHRRTQVNQILSLPVYCNPNFQPCIAIIHPGK